MPQTDEWLRFVIELSPPEAWSFRKHIASEDPRFLEKVAYHVLLQIEPFTHTDPNYAGIGLIDRLSQFGQRGDLKLSQSDADALLIIGAREINTAKGIDTIGAWASHFRGDILKLKQHVDTSAIRIKEWIYYNAIAEALLENLRQRIVQNVIAG